MKETEKTIENLNTAKIILCNQQMLTSEMCVRIGQAITDVIALLKENEAVVRCKDCVSFLANDDAIGATSNRSVMRCPCDCTNPNWFCADGRKKDG